MTYSTDIKTKESLLDKIEKLSELAYTKNAYVESKFNNLIYYDGYQQALKDLKELYNDL